MDAYSSCFDQVFDVGVAGSGYSGFAAAQRLAAAGRRVLLIGPRGDLLWESGRAFHPDAGRGDSPAWPPFAAALAACGGGTEACTDGAIAEILATKWLATSRMSVLYYAHPVAIEREDDAVSALIVATKSGLRRIVARQWVDATERGELLRMALPDLPSRAPSRTVLHAFFQFPEALQTRKEELGVVELLAARLTLLPSLWPAEVHLRIEMDGAPDDPYRVLLPALRRVHSARPGWIGQGVLSHCSVEPVFEYEAGAPASPVASFANVANASPALTNAHVVSLSERFALGDAAAARLGQLPVHEAPGAIFRRPIPLPASQETLTADVAVAGAGTGGALAAIAAGREGAKTLCFDPLEFAGGIPSGGGIHIYYYGVTGGLQTELDERIHAAMPLFGGLGHVAGFHPEARKQVLAEMLHEAGVRFLRGALLFGAESSAGRVASARVAWGGSAVRVTAKAWIDGTGDGDLCALAGAAFRLGRQGDGQLHAYSQSSGRVGPRGKSGWGMAVVNYDAGWTDPTDAEDLTRARLTGIAQYARPRYDAASRPTYIAPAIGLRQGRQIETDYVLSLADLVERRTFPDAIGFHGCHLDNHAVDYEFEDDEALFWVWGLRQWSGRLAVELPYRMLLPKGLENVWLASRAVGVSDDAHYAFRMQRDMQRIGEAAGCAAALAVRAGGGSRNVDFAALRERLAKTGAVDLAQADRPTPFNQIIAGTEYFRVPPPEEQVRAGLRALDEGRADPALWHVYRAGAQARAEVLQHLRSSQPATSFLAAALLAMWGDAQAEPRLLEAVRSREHGLEPAGPKSNERSFPEPHNRSAHRWVLALCLLRMCGTGRCVPVLADVAAQALVPLNVRTALALTLERLAQRGMVKEPRTILPILEQLTAGVVPGSFADPQRAPGALVERAARAASGETLSAEELMLDPADGRVVDGATPRESHRWQLHLAVAQARVALGLPPQPEAQSYLRDPRALVRRAFARALSHEPVCARGGELRTATA